MSKMTSDNDKKAAEEYVRSQGWFAFAKDFLAGCAHKEKQQQLLKYGNISRDVIIHDLRNRLKQLESEREQIAREYWDAAREVKATGEFFEDMDVVHNKYECFNDYWQQKQKERIG